MADVFVNVLDQQVKGELVGGSKGLELDVRLDCAPVAAGDADEEAWISGHFFALRSMWLLD
jgi:hypothetical protein